MLFVVMNIAIVKHKFAIAEVHHNIYIQISTESYSIAVQK